MMTNTSSKTSDERSRIASKTRAVSELQESKSCLETNNNKRIRIARRINNRNKKEPAQRITIAKQTTNNNRDKKKTIINNKTIKSAQRISIAKQEANGNRNKKDQRITIAERPKLADKRTRNRPIASAKAIYNRKPKERLISIAKCKANNNRGTKNKMTIANRNKKKKGTRISENTISWSEDLLNCPQPPQRILSMAITNSCAATLADLACISLSLLL